MPDLEIDYQQVEEALSALRRVTSISDDSTDKASWMNGDQTGTKWGRDESPTSFSSTYREFLTKLRTKLDQWSNDVSNVKTRTQQAQEALRTASEKETAAVNALLVEEWNQQSIPASTSGTAPGPGLGFGVVPVGPADSGAGSGSTSSGPGLGFGVVPVPGR